MEAEDGGRWVKGAEGCGRRKAGRKIVRTDEDGTRRARERERTNEREGAGGKRQKRSTRGGKALAALAIRTER